MSIKRLASAIGQYESGDNYNALGPLTSSGDVAYGKYQIMGANIPAWTKEATGASIDPQTFLKTPEIQDKTAQFKMGQYYDQYKNVDDVASAWFSGRPVAKAGNAADVNKTTVPQYVQNVKSIYQKTADPFLNNFSNKVDQSRKAGKTDTDILNYLASSDKMIADKIDQSKKLYGKQPNLNNDKDLVNFLAQTYGGSMPTVPSVAVKGSTGIVKSLAQTLVKPLAEVGTSVYNVFKSVGDLMFGVQTDKAAADIAAKRNIPFVGETEPAFTGKENTTEMLGKALKYGSDIAGFAAGGETMAKTLGEGILKGAILGSEQFGILGATAGLGSGIEKNQGVYGTALETVVGGLTGGISGGAIGGVIPIAAAGTGAIIKSGQKILNKFLLPTEEKITNAVTEGVQKGIKPYFGVNITQSAKDAYTKNANQAVRIINQFKPFLQDSEGNLVIRNPQTRTELQDALWQAKKRIYSVYDYIKQTASNEGAKVDLKPIANELRTAATDSFLQDNEPALVKSMLSKAAAYEKRGSLTAEESQAWVENINAKLKAFYRNPTPNDVSGNTIDAMVANNIRNGLDSSIDQAIGVEYNPWKQAYGALKTIEKDVNRGAGAEMRKPTKSLIDSFDILSGAELAKSLITNNPADLVKSGAMFAIKEWYKKINNPNTYIKSMFKALEEANNVLPESSELGKSIIKQRFANAEKTAVLKLPAPQEQKLLDKVPGAVQTNVLPAGEKPIELGGRTAQTKTPAVIALPEAQETLQKAVQQLKAGEVKASQLKDTVANLKEYKKQVVQDWLNTEEGNQFAILKNLKAEDLNEAQVGLNNEVVSAVKNSSYYRKEKDIQDAMGDDGVIFTNPKTNATKLAVGEEERNKLFDDGWKRGMSIDELAQEAGYEKGYDYLVDQMDLAGESKVSRIETEAHRELLKTDPNYKNLDTTISKLERELDNWKTEKAPLQSRVEAGAKFNSREELNVKLDNLKNSKAISAKDADVFNALLENPEDYKTVSKDIGITKAKVQQVEKKVLDKLGVDNAGKASLESLFAIGGIGSGVSVGGIVLSKNKDGKIEIKTQENKDTSNSNPEGYIGPNDIAESKRLQKLKEQKSPEYYNGDNNVLSNKIDPKTGQKTQEREMRISAYGPTGSKMSNGKYPKSGYVAVSDRNNIPLGSKIIIDGNEYEVGDRTASKIHTQNGDTIDIFYNETDSKLRKRGVDYKKVKIIFPSK